MENLQYRRQFVLCPTEISDFSSWNKYHITDKYILYAHPDLVQLVHVEKNKSLVLLGDLYDPMNPEFTNQNIFESLLQYDNLNELIEATGKFAGRFVIFFIKNSSISIFHDASAAKKVYYTTETESIWCASQPHVLAKYCKIDETEYKPLREFIKSDKFISHDQVFILDNTIYETVKQLLPNHYLDLENKKPVRFWPNKSNKTISLNEGIEEGSKMLKGIFESANNRYELMMAVTAGNDTRLLLAASRSVSSNVFYYTNYVPRLNDDHQDIVVPSKLFQTLGMKFNVLKYSKEVDEEFKQAYYKNTLFPSEVHLPIIYNYYKNFPDKINLPGTFSDISRSFFNTYRKNITPDLLAKIWDYGDIEYVIENYKIWIEKSVEKIKQYNYNVTDIFNWEERYGNWVTQYMAEKEIAQDEFAPYNCRNLMQIFLSVPAKYRDVHTNIYFRSMVKHLWPELLSQPFNPNRRKYTSHYLKKVNLYWSVRRIARGW